MGGCITMIRCSNPSTKDVMDCSQHIPRILDERFLPAQNQMPLSDVNGSIAYLDRSNALLLVGTTDY